MEETSSNDRELKKIKAEEKRQEALRRKKEEENRRKRVIADSIKEIDNVKRSKHVVFKDSDDESDDDMSNDDTQKNGKHSMKLFDEDDEDDFEENAEDLIKSRHVGKKAAKLMKLESKYGHDERFHLDSKFLEDDDQEEDEEVEEEGGEIKHKERKKDLVRPFNRYDPTNPVHVEWMKKYKEKSGFVEAKSSNEEEHKNEPEKIVVEGQYFKVDDALKNELCGGSSSFSFLSSIGRPEEKPAIVVEKPQNQENTTEPVNKKKKEAPKSVPKPMLNSIVIKKFFINPNTNEFRSIIANFRRTQKEENIKNAFKKAQPKLSLCYQSAKKNAKRRLKDNDRKLVYNKFKK
uniref:NUC153 domain-containing protein n=1 Tax=Strongyloides papillosus TaxID=174720 RepID=A0A0N5B4G6_STREA